MFLHGRREDISKSVVFWCVFGRWKEANVEKCRVLVGFLHGRREDMSKSVVFLCVFARSDGEVS